LITYENKGYDKKTYPKLMLKKLKVMGSPNFIYSIGDVTQGSLYRGFHVYMDQGSFLKNFLTNSELKIN
jgi:hypothetical protein